MDWQLDIPLSYWISGWPLPYDVLQLPSPDLACMILAKTLTIKILLPPTPSQRSSAGSRLLSTPSCSFLLSPFSFLLTPCSSPFALRLLPLLSLYCVIPVLSYPLVVGWYLPPSLFLLPRWPVPLTLLFAAWPLNQNCPSRILSYLSGQLTFRSATFQIRCRFLPWRASCSFQLSSAPLIDWQLHIKCC